MTPANASPDPRIQRTRDALLGAFFALVLERRYTDIKVADSIDRAGVGRSTFYEHFANKHAILARSLKQPFGPLADLVLPADNSARVTFIVQHFWGNRALARILFTGAMRPKVTAVLVQMIERRLDVHVRARPHPFALPTRLIAVQLGESILAHVMAWLAGAAACSADTLAAALRESTQAVLLTPQRLPAQDVAVRASRSKPFRT